MRNYKSEYANYHSKPEQKKNMVIVYWVEM